MSGEARAWEPETREGDCGELDNDDSDAVDCEEGDADTDNDDGNDNNNTDDNDNKDDNVDDNEDDADNVSGDGDGNGDDNDNVINANSKAATAGDDNDRMRKVLESKAQQDQERTDKLDKDLKEARCSI